MKTEKSLYNGKTLEQIASNLPSNMIQLHKDMYLNNCKRVIECQVSGYNINEIEIIKNANFILLQPYYLEFINNTNEPNE